MLSCDSGTISRHFSGAGLSRETRSTRPFGAFQLVSMTSVSLPAIRTWNCSSMPDVRERSGSFFAMSPYQISDFAQPCCASTISQRPSLVTSQLRKTLGPRPFPKTSWSVSGAVPRRWKRIRDPSFLDRRA